MNRRKFIYSNAAIAAVSLAGQSSIGQPGKKSLLSGIQCNPIDFLDEGIERCLDFMVEHAAINAIFCYSQTYHLGTAPLNVLAKDHPVQPRDPSARILPYQWMKFPQNAFDDLVLQHEGPRPEAEYNDRDIFKELVEPCRSRGIRVYARILEADNRRADRIPG